MENGSLDRVVYDCSVFFQGAARPNGPAGACIDLVLNDQVSLYLSSPVITEIADVLNRREIRRRFPALTPASVQAFIELLISHSVVLDDVPKNIPFARDPDDEPYLDLAIESKADFLVTRDDDLLDIAAGKEPAVATALFNANPALKIINPVQYLAERQAREVAKQHGSLSNAIGG